MEDNRLKQAKKRQVKSANEMPEELLKEMVDQVPEKMQGESADDVLENWQKEPADGIAEDILKQLAEDIPTGNLDGKEIDRQIDRRIRAVAVKVVTVALAGILCLLLIVNPAVKMNYYNPAAKQKKQAEGTTVGELAWYLNAYSSVFLPYTEIYDCTVKDRGFGRYTVIMNIMDHMGSQVLGGPGTAFEMEQGKWVSGEESTALLQQPARFEAPSAKAMEEILPELEELPDSSIVYCSLVLPQAVLPEELQQEGITVDWICVEQTANAVTAGIAIYRAVGVTEGQTQRRSATGVELKEKFLEELNLLVSDRKLLASLGVSGAEDGSVIIYADGAAALQEIIDQVAEQDAIRTRKICVYGKKQAILEYIDQVGAVAVGVDTVKISQWSR